KLKDNSINIFFNERRVRKTHPSKQPNQQDKSLILPFHSDFYYPVLHTSKIQYFVYFFSI
ncbi:MAG: hypothetical protein ACI9OS_002034, partial [Ulvibacter sp.]